MPKGKTKNKKTGQNTAASKKKPTKKTISAKKRIQKKKPAKKKKSAAKKSAAKKSATKKSTAKKPMAKKSAVKKSATKKSAAKKPMAKKRKTENKKTTSKKKKNAIKKPGVNKKKSTAKQILNKKSASVRKGPPKSALELEPDIETLLIGKKQKQKPKIKPQYIYKHTKPKISPHIVDLKQKTQISEPDDKTTDYNAQPNELGAVKLTKTEISEQFTKESLFLLPPGWKKAIAAFIAVALIIAGPIQAFSHFYQLNKTKEKVLNLTENAYTDLKIAKNAISNKQLNSAKQHFDNAADNFSNAKEQLNTINILLQPMLKIIPFEGKTLNDAENLLIVGQNISVLGEKMTNAFNHFYQNNSKTTDKISYLKNQINESLPLVNDTAERMEKINQNVIPAEFQDQFDTIKKQVSQFNQDFHTLSSFSDFMLQVLGHKQKKRYLIIFQNNSELRPTGGFMGSLALVDFYQGEIKNIEIPGGGPYDFQGTLYERLKPPAPLLLVNDRWQLQDSNWFFNFPASAKKIEWFYQKAGGPSVDGVIAINATLVENLLQHLDPIEMPEYNKVIKAENFINETQKAVELEYDKKENQPKKFIRDLTPKLLTSIFTARDENLANILKMLNQSFAKKEIQIYLNDPNLQEKVQKYNWSGQVKQTSKDYLAVVAINLLGGKTDRVIKQNIDLDAKIDKNGYITNTLTVKRTHFGNPTDIFEGMTNNCYLKIFAPKGSQLISAEGFSKMNEDKFFTPAENTETDKDLRNQIRLVKTDPISKTKIYQETGKTVFANWISTPVGQTKEIKISYVLPFRLNMPQPENTMEKIYNYFFENKSDSQFYSIFIQKQSGIENQLTARIQLPADHEINWLYPKESGLENKNSAVYETEINTDKLFGLIFENKYDQ